MHRHWDWASIAKELLFPFEGIDKRMLRAGVKSCFDNGTMYCQRIQVRQGRLYLTDYRAIFFDRHYAPARIMPMLEVMRRPNPNPNLHPNPNPNLHPNPNPNPNPDRVTLTLLE